MKILAFGASTSSTSINQQLAIHAAEVFKVEFAPDAEIDVIDLNDFEMPIYSQDRESADGIPDLAQAFLDKIGAADGVIISYAAHNGNYTAAFKNTFDWASRLNKEVFQGKPMVILSASYGAGGGASVLDLAKTSAPYFEADLRGNLSVGPWGEKWEGGKLSDPELASGLRDAVKGLLN